MTHDITDRSPRDGRFPVDPWLIREVGLDQSFLPQSESLFALSNGHVGLRGNLDEGDPSGLPGTYLNSFYETRPLPYAEAGYGYPESGQTVLNVTNGKLIRLLVDDEPLDLRYGTIESHERTLDMKRGVLERELVWCSPSGTHVRLHTSRLVSLRRRSLVAIRYRVTAVDKRVRVVMQSELVANEHVPAQSKDPRVAAVVEHALKAVEKGGKHARALLVHRTEGSRLQMAALMDHVVHSPDGNITELAVEDDWARYTFSTALEPDDELDVTKFVSYGWSSQRSVPALRDQVTAAMVSALHAGWDGVKREQEDEFAKFWDGADVRIDGDDELQQAVRFGIFHSFQAGARAEQRAIPAKGLTGPGYDGHAFWDTEMFVLPLLTATDPDAAADALRWRAATLQQARERAGTLHLSGATFPWRTIRGHECSAYWPAGTAAFHVNADVAAAVLRYLRWTGDENFEREVALPVLVETARLWRSLGYHGEDGCFHIDGVTGPDEYSAVSHDNVYTNLLAAQNLTGAADVVARWHDQAQELGVTEDETAEWRRAADTVAIPYSERHGVHEQSRGFTALDVWDFAASDRDHAYPLLLNDSYFDLYRKQVVKQADLALALHWAGDRFTAEEKARDFAYYEPLTVRDSSLSACTQAVVAAEVGHLELATAYLAEAALMDLHDLNKNGGDGLHIASLAGGWLAVVAGFGGMRDHGDRLTFRPQLPPGWHGLDFTVRYRGHHLRVAIGPDSVTYRVEGDPDDGGSVPVTHLSGDAADGGAGEDLDVAVGSSVERSWTAVTPLTETPGQPAGRVPARAQSRSANRSAD
ncbi:alpha,alpha-trehalose phosphorylase [Jatrophihabitans endophyticus]|uniref:Alpha,alpha-trehalose phosphorylase n=1 Tax=Jatrophihabitans endophyticus TaxID=1206085 RepID=A0A1M5E678_9ACTN|nr:glycosyl hydrolase family 65 protein [Jatrophihabitans endophyticus]SHF74670.1 alpha,alpha-trehalose phosphorylase [Jatrophihabitans endophyticus]